MWTSNENISTENASFSNCITLRAHTNEWPMWKNYEPCILVCTKIWFLSWKPIKNRIVLTSSVQWLCNHTHTHVYLLLPLKIITHSVSLPRWKSLKMVILLWERQLHRTLERKKSYARGWQINVCSKCALAHWFIPKPKWKEDTTADNSDFGHFVTNSMCPTKCFVDMWKQITCYDGIEISQFVANLSQRMWWRVDSFFQEFYGRLNIASTV